MRKILNLIKAVGFIFLAMIGFVVAPIAGAIIAVAFGIWLLYMIIDEHNRTPED